MKFQVSFKPPRLPWVRFCYPLHFETPKACHLPAFLSCLCYLSVRQLLFFCPFTDTLIVNSLEQRLYGLCVYPPEQGTTLATMTGANGMMVHYYLLFCMLPMDGLHKGKLNFFSFYSSDPTSFLKQEGLPVSGVPSLQDNCLVGSAQFPVLYVR